METLTAAEKSNNEIFRARLTDHHRAIRKVEANYMSKVLIAQHKIKRNPYHIHQINPLEMDRGEYDRLVRLARRMQAKTYEGYLDAWGNVPEYERVI